MDSPGIDLKYRYCTVPYLYGTAHSLIPEKVGSRQPAEILFKGRSGGDTAE